MNIERPNNDEKRPDEGKSDQERVVMWTNYTDASNHKELNCGEKYCVKTADNKVVYAMFMVYEGGEECDFICLREGRTLNVIAFRTLD